MRMTNRGIYRLFDATFRDAALPTNFYVALVTAADVPDPDTNVLSDLTECPAGNGYTSGGIQLSRNSTDFDSLVEDDTADEGQIQIKDLVWNASGGPLPSTAARYAVLLDDNATVANREVWGWWDLGGDTQVADGNPLTLQDLEIYGGEPA